MFRDTSMDYLSRDEVLEIWNNNMRLTDEQLLAMDETEFRARVRCVPVPAVLESVFSLSVQTHR